VTVPVKAFMSGDPITTTPDASALDALRTLLEAALRHLPVVDGAGRVVGVVSRDGISAALALPRGAGGPAPAELSRLREIRVADVMSHEPETVGPDASIAEAADRMADRRIGCLPVVDPTRRLVGILSETDLLRALAMTLWTDELREERERQTEQDVLVAGLRHERARIVEQLEALHATERELSATQHDQPMDDPERAADLREVRLAEKLDALAARRLSAIDRALDHAAQGRLALFESCGG
jgi:CBS domain-containing protein